MKCIIVIDILCRNMMMMIVPNSRVRMEVTGEYGRISGENFNADYGGMVQPSQQHVAPCVKGV